MPARARVQATPGGPPGKETPMLAANDLVAFAAVTDLDRAREFYGGTLGLPVLALDDFALVLDAHGTMLRVTAVPGHTPVPFTVLGWKVPDITAAVRELAAAGVGFTRYEGMDQDGDGIWT